MAKPYPVAKNIKIVERKKGRHVLYVRCRHEGKEVTDIQINKELPKNGDKLKICMKN